MKKGQAREKIIETAKLKFTEKGFANTFVNDIASEAGVSIGTLYYHFPQGKLSIYREIGKKNIETLDKKLKIKGFSIDLEFDTFSDGLKALIVALVKIHNDEREFILAVEAELLSKLDNFLKLKKEILSEEQIKMQTDVFLKPFRNLIKKFPNEGLSLKGKEKQFHKVLDILMHRNAYIKDTFGTEEEFVKILTTISIALLKS
ncbi:MAG: TetR/AcrR family transcriptional regulator [Candidatus Thorarchaeota archaeon]